jgi:Sigma-70 region 2
MNRTEELIALCKLGNTSGYTGLYNEHAQAVYNTILRLVGHSGEAEDILQESFVAAFQKIDQFTMTGGFGAWVKRIAINFDWYPSLSIRSNGSCCKRSSILKSIKSRMVPLRRME